MNAKIIVKIIGWVWLCIGVCSFFIGIGDLISGKTHQFIYLGIDVLTMIASASLLCRHSWGRILLQLIILMYLVQGIVKGIHTIKSVNINANTPHAILIMSAGGIFVLTVIWSLFFMACIGVLQLKLIRSYLSGFRD
jgi:hypothetical protein